MPPWALKLRLPGEEQISTQVDSLNEQLSGANDTLHQFRYFKALLTEQGANLEEVVAKAFELLDMPLSKPANTGAGIREDFVFQAGGHGFSIEVKGHAKGMTERDLNQLTSRLADAPTGGVDKCRGILVGNPFLNQEPPSRRNAFEPSLVEKALPWRICLLSTSELLNAVVARLGRDQKASEFKDRLISTVGPFTW